MPRCRAGLYAPPEDTMATTHKAITWERDFDAVLKSAGAKHVLVDFSAAPM